jgi:hypothetical protein
MTPAPFRSPLSRRHLLRTGSCLAAAGALGGLAARAVTPAAFPAQDPERVREMVGVAHHDLDAVRRLLRQPALAEATWDWGFGDWESALGAASHVGRADIAELLIAHGAAPTLFSAAMLGQLQVVKAWVEATPGIQRTLGPHSIPLLRHALAGGERARAVADYLAGVGGADGLAAAPPLTEEQLAGVAGTYQVEGGGSVTLSVERGRLTLAHGGRSRGLVHLGSFELHPAGAEQVRVRLSESAAGWTLTVHDPDLVLTALRPR